MKIICGKGCFVTGKLKRASSLWLGAASVLALTAQSASAQPPVSKAKAADTSVKPYDPSWGFNMSGMDKTVKPGDNFFEYANGTYLKNIVIPSDRASFGPFVILAETARERVQSILNDAGKHPSTDPKTTEEKLGAFYATLLDTAKADKLGATPLRDDLEAVRAVKDPASLAHLFGQAAFGFQYTPFG